KCHGAIAVVLERLVRHDGAEIGAADPDVDDVANALACMACPGSAPYPVREVRHRVENAVDLRHHVLAVDDDRCTARGAQGDMEDGTVFRHVELVSPEHGVDALP